MSRKLLQLSSCRFRIPSLNFGFSSRLFIRHLHHSRKSLLEANNTKLLHEFHPTKNGDISTADLAHQSHKKVWWVCSTDPTHEWEAMVGNRSRGVGCPYCSGFKVSEKTSMETLSYDRLHFWDYSKNGDLTPSQVGDSLWPNWVLRPTVFCSRAVQLLTAQSSWIDESSRRVKLSSCSVSSHLKILSFLWEREREQAYWSFRRDDAKILWVVTFLVWSFQISDP